MQSIFKRGLALPSSESSLLTAENSTYFANAHSSANKKELARKNCRKSIARPSDCLALATAQKRPIFVQFFWPARFVAEE